MSTRSHTCACGPIIVAALRTYSPAEDALSDGQIREAFTTCRAAGRTFLAATLKSGAACAWLKPDTALRGLAEREAESVLDLLGVDDAPAGLVAALVAEFISAYRAH